VSIPGPALGRPWLRRRNARLLRDAGRSVEEAGYMRAGGIDHFVTIRGASRGNPVLVFLHGGPGMTQTVFAAQTLRWEEHVTVVQYDQRGCGKTRHRNGAAADGELSFERLRLDATDLIDALRHKLGAAKVILAASSAGSTFGLQLAASRPDLLHAYVGTDQHAVVAESKTTARANVLETLRRTGNRKGIRALERMPSDPAGWTQAQSRALDRWAVKADPDIPNMVTDVVFPAMMTSPLHTMADIRELNPGMTESTRQLYPELAAFDARTVAPEMRIPFFVFQGADDNVTPAECARAFAETVRAPVTRFATIPRTGHLAAFTRPEEFLRLLLEYVLPVVPGTSGSHACSTPG
jgi:pimeloyl-ACP methyl ester carboxylesterase